MKFFLPLSPGDTKAERVYGRVADQQSYTAFYDTYAPKVWELILLANLAASQSEAILISTLTKAWQQLDQHLPTEAHFLTRLIGLACREGLPIECLRPFGK